MFNTAPGGRPNGQFNNLESVLTISASPASSNLTTAFTASVVTYSGGGALASTFYAVAMANNATMMAINTVCTDSSPATSGNFSGVRGQVEHDYFVRKLLDHRTRRHVQPFCCIPSRYTAPAIKPD